MTDGHPTRSARYHQVNVPNGFDDELRAALRIGDVCWGTMVLYRGAGEPQPSIPVPIDHGVVVPTEVFTVVNHARAIAAGRSGGTARARMLGRAGRWLVARATVVASPTDPADSQIAVVIEPANASEVTPIVVQAFELTPREREVTACVARGLDTGEIAAHLFCRRTPCGTT